MESDRMSDNPEVILARIEGRLALIQAQNARTEDDVKMILSKQATQSDVIAALSGMNIQERLSDHAARLTSVELLNATKTGERKAFVDGAKLLWAMGGALLSGGIVIINHFLGV